MTRELCETTKANIDTVTAVQQQLPDLSKVALLFKALADETRLKIAYALTLKQALCVCDVSEIIGSSVATASHHLRYLKENGLAKSHREGKQMYYSLKDDHVRQIVTIAYEHMEEVDDNGDENTRV